MKRDSECMGREQKECPNMLFMVDKCTCILRALDDFCSKVNQIKPVQQQQIPRRLQLSDKNLKNLILHLLSFLLWLLCHIGRRAHTCSVIRADKKKLKKICEKYSLGS